MIIKTYKMGKRFLFYRNILIALSTLMIFSFYFIYDYLMASVYPALRGAPLVAIFVLIEAVVVFIIRWGSDKIMAATTYTVTTEALEVQTGKNHLTLAWKDFEKAYYADFNLRAKCPVTYRVNGKEFLPNQYLDEIWNMHEKIVGYIRPYAEIEEGLERKISAFS